jgi:hypothetical protein
MKMECSIHFFKPFSDRDDERALVRSYLRVGKGRAAPLGLSGHRWDLTHAKV